jgi:eukaryotic-like serine/threonine-protein kinase
MPERRQAFTGTGASDEELELLRSASERILERSKSGKRYTVEKELARGGMGVINVVYDQDLRRISAMKYMPPETARDETRVQAFVEEARVTAQLEHPNIVPIHDIGIVDETATPYYAMKLIDGEPLNRIIAKISRGVPEYVEQYHRMALLNIFSNVCNAVAYAHSRGVIHRDIKPENIMVGRFGEVLLMDWGLAKYIGGEDCHSGDERIDTQDLGGTLDGIIKGSPAYMSPEQACGEVAEIDQRTDIFLLGATLYHMFTFAPPYVAKDVMEMVSKAEFCDHLVPTERHPDGKVPLALERIILTAMAPVRENRYQTVEQLIDDIDAYVSGRRVCGRRVFHSGEKLIEAGERSRDTFVIIEGLVDVYRLVNGREIRIASLGPGELVGEMASISNRTRSANVVARHSTDTLVLTYEAITEELQKLPPWLEQIMLSLAERVRVLDEHFNPVLLNQRFLPIISQLHCIYLTAKAPGLGQISSSFSRSDVVDELAMQLGLDEAVVSMVTDALIDSGMCRINEHGQYRIIDLEDFQFFVDYCRYKLEPDRGVRRVESLRLTNEREAAYDRALRKLKALSNGNKKEA